MNIQLQEIKSLYIKNRLTEGVDFKRYEWLDSTSGRIGLVFNETDFQSLTMYRIGNPNSEVMITTRPNYGNKGMFFNFESWIPGFALYNPGKSYITINEQNLQFTLTKSGDNIIYKGVSTITINYPMNKLLQVIVAKNMTRLKSVTTSTGQYIPCQLLQDIPASLSINNKAYTVGTCGLYYTTTGKFIGNSNLTVEGEVEPEIHTGLQQIYQNKLIEGVDYETYDWLIGDDTAIIEWSANVWNNQLHTIIGKDKKTFIVSNINPNSTASILCIKYDSNNFLMVIFKSESKAWHIADIYPYSSVPNVVDLKFYINNSVGYCVENNGLFTGHNMATVWNDNVKFNVYGGKMKILQEYDSTNDKLISSLVPCQLLRSIPRNLDAQCKERVAGECGMIDLISGKFYGNVASSGTFTVENDNNE